MRVVRIAAFVYWAFSACTVACNAEKNDDGASVILSSIRKLKAEGKYIDALSIAQACRPKLLNRSGGGQLSDDELRIAHELGMILLEIDRYEEAQEVFKALIEGSISRSTIWPGFRPSLHNNLALAYQNTGRLREAYDEFNLALPGLINELGEEDRNVAITHSNIGSLEMTFGDLKKALPNLERSLDISLSAKPIMLPEAIQGLINLSFWHQMQGETGKALESIESAEHLHGLLPSKQATILAVYNNKGMIQKDLGNFRNAESTFRTGISICIRDFSDFKDHRASLEANLGELYRDYGHFDKAIIHLRTACELSLAFGRGAANRHYAQYATYYATVLHQLGDNAKASVELMKITKSIESELANVFSFATENQRVTYFNIIRPIDLTLLIGSDEQIANQIIRFKNLAVDSVCEDRQLAARSSADEISRNLFAEYLDTCKILMRLKTENKVNNSGEIARIQETESKSDLLYSQLARQFFSRSGARKFEKCSAKSVAASLPNDTVLLEFIQYLEPTGPTTFRSTYGVCTILPNSSVSWLKLEKSAEAIDRTIGALQKLIRQPREQIDEETLLSMCTDLYDDIFRPIHDAHIIPQKIKRLLISGDGALNFLPFGILHDGTKSLLERFDVVYVSTGRDLQVRPSLPIARTAKLLIDPLYGDKGQTNVKGASSRGLAWTRGEITELSNSFAKAGWELRILTGENASESEFRRVQPVNILEVSAHGLFSSEGEGLYREASSPMDRSAILLSSGDATLEQWKRGVASTDSESDGVLTASEVATLNLNGTRLLVAAACDSGFGESTTGDGILGLRRAFAIAGCEQMVSALWPIAHEKSKMFMSGFYRKLIESNSQAEFTFPSFQRETFLAILNGKSDVPDAAGLRDAIFICGAFILHTQRGLHVSPSE